MVCIIAYKHYLFGIYLYVETTFHPRKGAHAFSNVFCRNSSYLCESHCSHTVFYVYVDRHTQIYVGNITQRRNEIKHDSAVTYTYVLGMEISFVHTVIIETNTVLKLWLQSYVLVHYECTAFAY